MSLNRRFAQQGEVGRFSTYEVTGPGCWAASATQTTRPASRSCMPAVCDQRGHDPGGRRDRRCQLPAAHHRQGQQAASSAAAGTSSGRVARAVAEPSSSTLAVPQPRWRQPGQPARAGAHLQSCDRCREHHAADHGALIAPQLCNAAARTEHRHPGRADPARPRQHRHHGHLHPPDRANPRLAARRPRPIDDRPLPP